MRYSEQLERVQRLPMRGATSRRFDCFGCGGANSLSVNVANGETSWYCFRASCGLKGRAQQERTADDLRKAFDRIEVKPRPFSLPPHIVSVGSSMEAVEWMRKNHVTAAWQAKRCEVRYDPRTNRIVFLLRDRGELVDAVGRALSKATKPKWLRYGSSERPLTVGEVAGTAVVVEDAASACAVSGVATGVALLGTHLTDAAIGFLRGFERVIVALDPDATTKALSYQQILTRHVPTRVVRLSDDLKYFDEERIRKELRMDKRD